METAQQTEDYRWITCKGCGGNVGIPSDLNEQAIECPRCGTTVQASGRVLYRPPVQANMVAAVPAATLPAQSAASLELGRKADGTMICGVLSVFLGWTIIVPIVGICFYGETSKMAKAEQVPIPGRATVGFTLSLLFGIVQGLMTLVHLTK